MPKRPGRKSAAQTPAPKSERIKGSSKNPKGSAASSKAGEKIRLSREIINTLTEKAKKFNEENPRKKVTLGTLKAVFRRGSGAYSSSHRPTITGGKPNSRTAWSYARVNTFLAKKAGKPTKAAYVQDDDLLEDGGHISPLLAPNGKPSNLTPLNDGGLTAVDPLYSKGGKTEEISIRKYGNDIAFRLGRKASAILEKTSLYEALDYMPKATAKKRKEYEYDKKEKFMRKNKLMLNDDFYYIDHIEVKPKYRGQGYGSKIMKAVLDWAKKNKVRYLFLYRAAYDPWDTDALNDNELKKFYQRYGFKEIGAATMVSEPQNFSDGGLTAVKLYDTFDTAKDIDDIVSIAQEKKINAKELSYDEFKEKITEHLPERDLDFIELKLAYKELKKTDYARGGKTKEKTMKAKGNCYEAAGDVVIMYKSPFSAMRFSLGMDDLEFKGEPYLVHAEVAGQGALEGIRYGHAWIEDDVFVYDFSNNRQIVLPKDFYYQIGDVKTEDPKKYRKYTFDEAKRKMLDEGTYGCWDIETEYRDGGRVYNDQELLKKWKAGEKIGFSATAHLKSKGLIPRSDGSKKVSMAEGAEVVHAANMIKCSNCGWSWSIYDSDPFDMYVCHQCGTDNTPNLLETQDVARMNGYVLLRFLEFAKEDAKTDMELHKLVENIMALSATKTLTMDDYEKAMEGIAPVEMAHGGQVFDTDLYGMRKTMLNTMYGQYLKFADNLDPSQLQGKTKEEWAKKETLDWARKMSKTRKIEEEEVLIDVRTGQVMGNRKDYMIRPQYKKGGVVLFEDIEDYNQDKVKFGGYEVGSTAYLAKKDAKGNWISAGTIVGYKEKGRFGDLYIVTDKGQEIHNTQLLEVQGLEKYGFKMDNGGETPAETEIDIDNLDPLERLMYEDMSKKMDKKDALRIIINTFEADGQLSEELEKYAAKLKLEEIYASQIQTELETAAHYYDKPFTLWVSGLDNSGGWEYFNLSQAIEGANNLGILENNNNYEIRDTASGRLVLTKAQILDVISGKASAEEFAFGGDVEDQVMDEVESEAYIADEKEEARAILYSRKMSKLQKILFISDRIDFAREQLKRAKDGLEENVWEEIFDIWKDTFARVENNYCERVRPEYKEGGVTSDCGCGKYYEKGGLAYGNSHAKGGMPMTVKSTGQNIEIEGGEGVVNKKSMQMTKKVTLNGEQMTPCEAVSEINEMGGGVKFKCADVKEIIEDDGNF